MSRFTVTVRTEPLCEGASANNKGCSGESVALLTTVDISTITHLCSIQVRRMGRVYHNFNLDRRTPHIYTSFCSREIMLCGHRWARLVHARLTTL